MASFGPSRTVSDGNSMLRPPEGGHHAQHQICRFNIVAVVLLAGACGGDEDDHTVVQVEGTIEIAPEQQEGLDRPEAAQPAPGVDDMTEQLEATQPEGGSVRIEGSVDVVITEEPQAPAASEEQGKVQLGTRFRWCRGVQAVWERHDEALAALTEAQEYAASATDELSRAEAQEDLKEAERDYRDVSFRSAGSDTILKYLLYESLLSYNNRGADTRSIAYALAWEALVETDPAIGNTIDYAWSGRAAQNLAASLSWDSIYTVAFDYLVPHAGVHIDPEGHASGHANHLTQPLSPGPERMQYHLGAGYADKPIEEAGQLAISHIESTPAYQTYVAAYDAADAALAELVAGSEAYRAFKESFQDSCQE